ncbi:RNaseH domain-containing protein [Streptomyces noursei]|uniref:RNaseH domain-containing protein n=1 Tax=Streptomyces noursei TaxID=1971 RepID=UPI0037DA12A2
MVARCGGWREEQLVGLAARVSEQAAMWDGRTNLPAPLHLAKSADEKKRSAVREVARVARTAWASWAPTEHGAQVVRGQGLAFHPGPWTAVPTTPPTARLPQARSSE